MTYPLEELEPCLRDTYGVIVYQEQVMQIAQITAKYTLGGADLLTADIADLAIFCQLQLFFRAVVGDTGIEQDIFAVYLLHQIPV